MGCPTTSRELEIRWASLCHFRKVCNEEIVLFPSPRLEKVGQTNKLIFSHLISSTSRYFAILVDLLVVAMYSSKVYISNFTDSEGTVVYFKLKYLSSSY